MAKVPSSSALMSSSSSMTSSSSSISNTNSGTQENVVSGVGRDFTSGVGRDFTSGVGRDFTSGVGRDSSHLILHLNVGQNIITGSQENNPRNITESQENNPRSITGSQENNPRIITGSQENNPRNITESQENNPRNITESQENNPRNITESQENNPRNITESQENNPRNITESQENNPRNISEEDSSNLALKKAGRCAGHRRVLIAGVLIAGVLILITGVFILKQFMLKQKKLSVAVDASLSATAGKDSSWFSSSGDFAFGFRQLENSDLFLLCIWYAKIWNRTVVWYGNGGRPVPKGSTIKLTANSGLVLTSPGGENLWDQTITGVVAHGVMNDTGNFVLEDDKSESLWETFKNPTDTMLPGQIIEKGGKLSSRQSETDYTRGRFQLDFQQQDGNLVFNQLDFQQDGNLDKKPFCSTRTTNGTVKDSEGKQLVFDDLGNLYILRVNDGKFNFTVEERPTSDNYPASGFYLRATLNFDGVLALYYLPKSFVGNANWTALWFQPHQVDSGAGDCAGNCSNCYLNVYPRLTCECPRG